MNPTVVFGFDMETDIGSWTPFNEGLVHGTPRILEILADRRVVSTFYFTGDAARSHPEIVHMVRDAKHEVGCHSLYHETLGDELFAIPGLRSVLPEECYHRVEVATKVVENIAGVKMLSFRAPRLWGSTAMLNALEDLGYKTDASYPMFFYKDRLAPYHPSRADWTLEGDMKILEIPNFADMTMHSEDPHSRDRDQWPKFRTESAAELIKNIDRMLEMYGQKKIHPVLCFYFHPWEFHEMPQGLIHFGEGAVLPDPFIVKNCGKYALEQLDLLIKFLKDRDAEFKYAKDIV